MVKKANKKIKNDLTELLFVIDKSGSMSGLENDTIGGFNSVIKQNKEVEGDAFVSVLLFDTEFTWLYKRVPIQDIPQMLSADYRPGGCTALLDAMGEATSFITGEQDKDADAVPAKTIGVIITDGEENASREYSLDKIKSIIEKKQEEGWEFLFLGANIDAITTAGSFGINASHAATYVSDSQGTTVIYGAVGKAMAKTRAAVLDGNFCCMEASWKSDIEEDTASRSK